MTETKREVSGSIFFFVAGAILIFGLLMLGSATAPTAQEKFGNTYHFLYRQILLGVLPGVFLFLLFQRIPVVFWEKIWKAMFPISIILLVLVFIPGLRFSINNSFSWIHLGSFTFQTSELVKLTFIIFLAGWLANNKHVFEKKFTEGLLQYIFYVVIICGLLIAQPDFGTMCVFLTTSMVLAFIAGAQTKHLLVLFSISAVILCGLILAQPYRLQRIKVLFDPDSDPYKSGYHLKQSFIALGSGGILGLGFGNSHQKFQYLPEVSSDSIFAVIGEELGFIVSTLVIVAYGVIILKGYRMGKDLGGFSGYFIYGTITWIGIQTFLNIGAMVGLVPLTGLPLPFISHGGSALMMTLASFGVIYAMVSGVSSKRLKR